jgi:hypothetical protein
VKKHVKCQLSPGFPIQAHPSSAPHRSTRAAHRRSARREYPQAEQPGSSHHIRRSAARVAFRGLFPLAMPERIAYHMAVISTGSHHALPTLNLHGCDCLNSFASVVLPARQQHLW